MKPPYREAEGGLLIVATQSLIDLMLRPSFKAGPSNYPGESCFFPWR